MSSVSVIIVTYFSEATITDCLKSIPEGIEVIVVDNGSRDNTQEKVEAFPNARLIKSTNRGFGASCNLGASQASGDYLLLLNPDAALHAGTIEALLSCLKNAPKTGCVGPAIFDVAGKPELSWGKTPNILSEWQRKREHLAPPAPPKYRSSVDWVSGACQMLPIKAWQEIGGFDEKFFLYFEDIDLCKRLSAKGWAIMFEPSASVYHVRGHSASQNSGQTEVFYRQSQRRFYQKHTNVLQRRLLGCYLTLKYLPKFLLGDKTARQILMP